MAEETETKNDDTVEVISNVNKLSITDLYNLLQRSCILGVSTKYIDLRHINEFNKYHITSSINIMIKNKCVQIKSFDDISITDTINAYSLKSDLKLLGRDTVIIFIDDVYDKNNYKLIQTFLFNTFEIKQYGILSMNNLFTKFTVKYPWMITKDNNYIKKDEKLLYYPHEIIDNKLYLGNYQQSEDKQMVFNLALTHMINITDQSHLIKIKNISYYQMSIDDDGMINILENDLLLNTINYIDKILNENNDNKILVHCHMGVSRSSTVIIAYLMSKNKWAFDKSFDYVKSIRPRINPNDGFKKQLLEFQKSIL